MFQLHRRNLYLANTYYHYFNSASHYIGYPGEQSQQVGSCVKCRKNNANPGFKWCQNCYDGNNAGMCLKCGKNPPNAGFKWCEPCFQNKKAENPIDCVPEELPQAERCPSCDKKKFYDLKKKKLFDFCGQTCAAQHYKSEFISHISRGTVLTMSYELSTKLS